MVFASVALFTASTLALADEQKVEKPEAAHGIAMYGAPAYSADFSHFDYVNPEAPKGGTLRLAIVANGYDSFNPFVARGVAAAGLSTYTYDTLMTSSADEPFSAYGLIAESIETPDDRSYAVFNLRPEAKFQDGKPITADDVVFSFNLLTSEGHPFFRSYYGEVSKVTAENSHRVRFDFGETSNRELPLILGQLPVLPKHYWEEREFQSNGFNKPVGSGPYTIGDYEAGRSITYVRNKDYWAKDLPVNKGRYNFDQVRYEYYTDDTVALEAFKAGQYDWRAEYSAKNWATAYTGKAFENDKITKVAIEHHRPAGMQGFLYNTRRPQFQNSKVREALAYAFDFEWANKNLFFDQYTRIDSYFENSDLASSGLPKGEELALLEAHRKALPESVFTEPYQPPTTSDGVTLRDNLRTAFTLLKEAGYEIRDGKMVHADSGESLDFEIMIFQKSLERVALPFVANLRKLGIEVNIRTVDSNQYVNRMRDFDFDMVVQSLPQSDSPGNEQREYWSSQSAEIKGSRNYAGVSDPVVDDLVKQLIASPDREALVNRTRALDRVLLHSHYVIPHYFLSKDRIAYWNTLARPEVTPKDGTDLSYWWFKAAD